MPFGQLILGSPGAGKSTYCDGSESTPIHPLPLFRRTLDRAY